MAKSANIALINKSLLAVALVLAAFLGGGYIINYRRPATPDEFCRNLISPITHSDHQNYDANSPDYYAKTYAECLISHGVSPVEAKKYDYFFAAANLSKLAACGLYPLQMTT